MWTAESRQRYNRDKLRYPSDLTDAEWSQVEEMIPPARRGGRRREVDARCGKAQRVRSRLKPHCHEVWWCFSVPPKQAGGCKRLYSKHRYNHSVRKHGEGSSLHEFTRAKSDHATS